MKHAITGPLAGVALGTLLLGCAGGPGVPSPAEFLDGRFSSEAQSNTEDAYFHVLLRHGRIWPAREDGEWVYVEQAMASSPAQPYRQRIYQFVPRGHTAWISRIYTLPSPEDAVGAWHDPDKLAGVVPEELSLRSGCDVLVEWNERDRAWVGGTRGKGCESNLRGASYATSEVRIAENVIESWDRGYSKYDAQVWGAVDGPYVFRREN